MNIQTTPDNASQRTACTGRKPICLGSNRFGINKSDSCCTGRPAIYAIPSIEFNVYRHSHRCLHARRRTRHECGFLRTQLTEKGVISSCGLTGVPAGTKVAVAGLSICRQRPGSAKGTVFITLEDEAGVTNLIVWPKTFQAFRKPILRASLIYAEGIVQKDGLVIHVLADRLVDMSGLLYGLTANAPVVSAVSARADRLRHNRRSVPVHPRRFQVLTKADESIAGPPDQRPGK